MTVRAFVIGHPIAHSRSPLVHRYWLDRFGIDGSYQAIDVAPEALGGFLNGLRDSDFAGGNVTIPHKLAAFRACDECDPAATRIGAVNTLIVRHGRLVGRNTDAYGFLANLDAEAPGWDGAEDAIVLGAGGAAPAIIAGLLERGFGAIHLLNRTLESADELASRFGPQLFPGGLADFGELAGGTGLVVNTTSLGMHGTRIDDIDVGHLPSSAVVTDCVYVPLETPLLADARARGLTTVDGLGMLLHQAVPGFEAWFGVRPEISDELRALVAADIEPAR